MYDVNTSGILNNSVLKWNSSSEKFEPSASLSLRSITPHSITTTANCTNSINFYTTASTAKTITFTNVVDGISGQVEVSYSGAAKITFASSGYTVNIASNIYDSAAKVLSKTSGTAIYSYYIRNSKIYINGTQAYK